jgi:endonuclease III
MSAHEFRLLQEIYAPNTWKQLVCNILLNRTNRTQVDRIRTRLFAKWRTPSMMALADPEEMYRLIKELGFGRQRTRTLIEFSRDWATKKHDSWDQIKKFRGMGRYAHESYRIFTLGETDFIPTDKKLKAYIERHDTSHD